MNNTVNIYLGQLEQIKKEISLIKSRIDEVTEKYQKDIRVLNNQMLEKNNELLALRNAIKFKIRLGDLMEEISKLSGVDINSMEIKLETNVAFLGIHNVSEMMRLLNNNKSYFIRMNLESISQNKDAIKFHYFTFLPLNFDSIQYDGNMLINHCSVSNRGVGDKVYTEIDIDRNIEDIILNFDINCLETNDNASWYPANLFAQAIVNCTQQKNVKVREKVNKKTVI